VPVARDWQLHGPAAIPPGKQLQVSFNEEAVWVLASVWILGVAVETTHEKGIILFVIFILRLVEIFGRYLQHKEVDLM